MLIGSFCCCNKFVLCLYAFNRNWVFVSYSSKSHFTAWNWTGLIVLFAVWVKSTSMWNMLYYVCTQCLGFHQYCCFQCCSVPHDCRTFTCSIVWSWYSSTSKDKSRLLRHAFWTKNIKGMLYTLYILSLISLLCCNIGNRTIFRWWSTISVIFLWCFGQQWRSSGI